MNNLSILLKNSFNNMIGAMLGKKKKRTVKPSIIIVILTFLGFLALSFFQAFSQYVGLAPMGLAKMPLFNGVMITFVILVLYVSMKITATPKTNDTDLLLSLPIKKSTIALAKILTRYLFDLMMAFLLLLPYIVLYLVYVGFSLSFLLSGLLVILIMPLLSVGLNYILDFVVTHLFNKTKYSLVLKSAFAFIIFLLSMGLFVFTMPSYGIVDPTQVNNFIYRFPPISWFLKFILEQNIISLILILSITILPFLFGVILYTKNLGKTFATYKVKHSEIINTNSKGVLNSLIKKEIKRYFYTPIYLLNTIVGPVFMIGFTIFILLKGQAGLTEMIGMPVEKDLIFAVLTIVFCFFLATTLISASAISLEGKNLWILKSTPAPENKVLFSKTVPNILLTVPIVIISTLALSFVLNFTIIQSILFVTIPVVASLIISFGGLFINLLLPKLEWAEEVQVVKQGLSVVVGMLLGFIVAIFPIGLYFLFPALSIVTLGLITLMIDIIICLILIILLFTKGKKIFVKL